MKLNKLSDRTAKAAPEGLHSDGGGLYLSVKTSGAKAWVFIYKVDKRRREMGLGGFPTVKLADARIEAAAARAARARGEDPLELRRALDAEKIVPAGLDKDVDGKTFKAVSEEMIESLAPGWRGAKTRQSWERSLYRHAEALADKPPRDITTQDILDVLKPLWTSRPESAGKLRDRLELVLDVAKVNGLREGENPARWRGHLALLLPKRKKLVRGHHRALPYERAPGFMTELVKARGMAARALTFVVLTVVREGVVRAADWREISEDRTLWIIPAAKMKSPRDLRVPLSLAARAVLAEVDPRPPEDRTPLKGLVFPGRKAGKPLSNASLVKVLKALGVAADATIHGFRSTLRDWAGDETEHPREVIEAALAHLVGDETEQAYRRRDALAKRRRLMDDWGSFLSSKPEA